MTDFALPFPHALPESLTRTKRKSATFVELVHARFDWKASPTDRARERYEAMRAAFEADHGEIVDEHWSERVPSGGGCTARRGAWRPTTRSSRACCATQRASRCAPATSSAG